MTTKTYSFATLVEWCAFFALRTSGEIPLDDVRAYFASNTFEHVMIAPDDPANPTEDDITLAADAIVNQIWTWHRAEMAKR